MLFFVYTESAQQTVKDIFGSIITRCIWETWQKMVIYICHLTTGARPFRRECLAQSDPQKCRYGQHSRPGDGGEGNIKMEICSDRSHCGLGLERGASATLI